ncbi:MAG TPA: putative zinc-binding metallopeptidase [Aromatoleum sp.]|uniref:zinc-binding metallopeptidase family protein n=1 Tax=Aromatoleum sp. TaxID=2307007 RepID=UPI002B47F56A|nr:putative zinc-binding metallopeptidase [Aromatoleum sp.]HJV24650.1 putative zinc-binding metallopeptidase [Aromatoleum sp.]
MKTFYCTNCGFIVFFENVSCGNCGAVLGFEPGTMEMGAFAADSDGTWHRLDAGKPDAAGRRWRQCRNYAQEQVCNWMVSAEDNEARCRSCRHTEHTPALDDPANKSAWYRLETAKRHLFYSLYRLGLPVEADHQHPAPVFRFLGGDGTTATTGHVDGTVTLDIAEADDACRESRRQQFGEAYRTLLGHFRHEIGHYYWDRLIHHGGRLAAFRTLFGDERRDYSEASKAYYANPPTNWADSHISAYATMHPWEDWAETWAHYLNISDALDTAKHWGFALHSDQSADSPADVPEVTTGDQPFRQVLLEQWLPLSQFLNSMARSLGHSDVYPFVIANPVLDKLVYVHHVIEEAAGHAKREP